MRTKHPHIHLLLISEFFIKYVKQASLLSLCSFCTLVYIFFLTRINLEVIEDEQLFSNIEKLQFSCFFMEASRITYTPWRDGMLKKIAWSCIFHHKNVCQIFVWTWEAFWTGNLFKEWILHLKEHQLNILIFQVIAMAD